MRVHEIANWPPRLSASKAHTYSNVLETKDGVGLPTNQPYLKIAFELTPTLCYNL